MQRVAGCKRAVQRVFRKMEGEPKSINRWVYSRNSMIYIRMVSEMSNCGSFVRLVSL
jgi:hypothetical protein